MAITLTQAQAIVTNLVTQQAAGSHVGSYTNGDIQVSYNSPQDLLALISYWQGKVNQLTASNNDAKTPAFSVAKWT